MAEKCTQEVDALSATLFHGPISRCGSSTLVTIFCWQGMEWDPSDC